MKDNLTIKDLTPEARESVMGYLKARAAAQTMRRKVDQIAREVLQGLVLTNDLDVEHGLPEKQITDPGDVYLCRDGEKVNRFYGEMDNRTRQAGLKPKEMPADWCPALVLEDQQRDAELAIINAAATMMQLDMDGRDLNNALLCQKDGLSKRQEFIDLMVKIVINS